MTEEKDTYIESVADYLNTLPQNQEFFDTLLDKLTLFRGQGNKEWDLMPSVMCTSQQKLDTNFKYYFSINLISVQYGASFATFLSG